VTGRVSSSVLSFPGAGTFAKPSAADVFSCSTGPFGNYPKATADEMGAIGARLAAALNRSTLVAFATQPDGAGDGAVSSNYYKTNPTNHYSRIVHSVNLDGRGYAFPYDDVVPSGATGPDQAGTVFDGAPELLTVTLGGLNGSSGGSKQKEGEVVVGGGDGETKKDSKAGDKKKREKKTVIDFAGLLKKIMVVLKGVFRK
jgi:hypothetical protein